MPSNKELLNSNSSIASLARSVTSNPEWTLQQHQEKLGYFDKQSKPAINVLASRLRRMLLDSLFVLDISVEHFSEFTTRHYRCEKDVFCAKIFFLLGAREIGAKSASKTLKEAQALQLTSLEVELLGLLSGNSFYLGQKTEHAQYHDQLALALDRLTAETHGTYLFEHAMIEFVRSASDNLESSTIAREAADEVRSMFAKHQSFMLGLIYYRLQNASLQAALSYGKAIKVCREAIRFVNKHKVFQSPNRFLEFHLHILTSAISLGNTAVAEDAAAHCAELSSRGHNNWFVVAEPRYQLLMQTDKFSEALELTDEIRNHARFPFQPDHIRTKWDLFRDYALYATEQLTEEHFPKKHETFSKKTLLESLPSFEKDKAGFNFALIVLQILTFFERGEFEAVFDRLDALRVYAGRYLKEYEQARVFTKALTEAEKHHDDPAALKKLIPPILAQIKTLKETKGYYEGMQIIPYPKLGKMFLSRIAPPRRSKQK